jgi:uncharacterized cupin superfamily protein
VPDDLEIPVFNVNTVEYRPFPEMGGGEALLYRSDDGMRVAGSFKEAGQHTMTMPYDEFIYVVAGRMSVTPHGGKRYDLGVGECCYIRQGMTVDFDMADGFQDVTVLMSNDNPITY